MNIVLISVWALFMLCIVATIFIDVHLVQRLKNDHQSAFENLGRPSSLTPAGSISLMTYCIFGNYKEIPDKKLIFWFDIKRNITVILFLSFLIFLLSLVVGNLIG